MGNFFKLLYYKPKVTISYTFILRMIYLNIPSDYYCIVHDVFSGLSSLQNIKLLDLMEFLVFFHLTKYILFLFLFGFFLRCSLDEMTSPNL